MAIAMKTKSPGKKVIASESREQKEAEKKKRVVEKGKRLNALWTQVKSLTNAHAKAAALQIFQGKYDKPTRLIAGLIAVADRVGYSNTTNGFSLDGKPLNLQSLLDYVPKSRPTYVRKTLSAVLRVDGFESAMPLIPPRGRAGSQPTHFSTVRGAVRCAKAVGRGIPGPKTVIVSEGAQKIHEEVL